MSGNSLETLYVQAQQAIKARDYNRASDLLKQILVIDEDYKDASRLLARIVKEKRRRWYNDVRIWGTLGILLLIGSGLFIAPKISSLYVSEPTAPVIKATTTPSPTDTAAPTQTLPPTPTPIPLTWKRIYGGDEFRRAIITAIVVDPRDADVIYVGTESAGIYKSIDGGMSWKPAHQGLLLANVDTLVIDPDNPRTLYASVAFAGVYKTTDGGENWQINKEDSNGNSSKIVMDQTDGSHLYYAEGGRVSQSKDSGGSWEGMNSSGFSSGIVSLALHPKDSKMLLMAGSDDTVYISHDEGAAWALLYAPQKHTPYEQIRELKIDSVTGNLVLVLLHGDSTSVVYSSTDGGKTWSKRPGQNCESLTIHTDGETILCGTIDGAIYKSTDAAQTWSLLAALPIGQVKTLVISPHDPNVLLAGGDGLYISTDGGKSWIERSNGLGRRVFEFGISPVDGAKFYVVDGLESYGDWFIHRSLDYGVSWQPITNSCQLDFGAAGNLICGPGGYNVQALMDTGEYYQKVNIIGPCAGSYAANPYRQGEFYGEDCIGGIKISRDGGRSWKNTSISENASTTKFFFGTDQKTIYMVTGQWSYGVWSSMDGENWTVCGEVKLPSPQSRSRFAIDPNDNAHTYLATRGEGVYTSRDGCKSWQTSNTGLDNMFINTVATNLQNSNLVYAGTDSGAYISTDGGDTWSQINDGLLGATVVYSIVLDKDSNVYATTPYGIFKLENK